MDCFGRLVSKLGFNVKLKHNKEYFNKRLGKIGYMVEAL